MARYIDADLLRIEMEDLYEHHIEMRNFSADGAVADCLTMLNNAPTADVEEVKHGEWFLLDECSNEGVYCSECHKKVYRKEYANQKVKSKFCPNCGAKMDGGKENEL